MAQELDMIEDGIVRLAFIGDITDVEVDTFLKGFQTYLEAATLEQPLGLLVDASRDGKMAPSARRNFTELNKDPRLGHIGICNVSRFNRVVATFIMKATGRDNIRFFESQADALAWLKSVRKPSDS